jgi:5-methylcytosine-specific restriction endonuclease McrA
MKKCSKCGNVLPLTSFYKAKEMKSGYRSNCKKCDLVYNRTRPVRIKTEPQRLRKNKYMRLHLAEKRANDSNYLENKRARDRQYRMTDKGKASSIRSKANRRKHIGHHILSGGDWNIILRIFGNMCVYCGSGEEITADHFIPISKGGQTTLDNIVPACHSCNSSKQDKNPKEWCDNYDSISGLLDTMRSPAKS